MVIRESNWKSLEDRTTVGRCEAIVERVLREYLEREADAPMVLAAMGMYPAEA